MLGADEIMAEFLSRTKKLIKRINGQGPVLILVLLFVFAVIRYDYFSTLKNMSNIFRQVSMIGMCAIGVTFVIISGGFDLSVASMAVLSGCAAAVFGNHLLIAMTIPLLIGMAGGFLNGLIVTKIKVVPFITTLSTSMVFKGIALLLTNSKSTPIPDQIAGRFSILGQGSVMGIPIPTILFVITCGIAIYISRYTKFGRHVYAVGANESASRSMGVRVDEVRMIVYTISGFTASIAGLILASRLNAGQPTGAYNWEMNALMATIVGGTLSTGGVGKFQGTFIGVLLLGFIQNILNMEGTISSWWQDIIMGVLLVFVIVLQRNEPRVLFHRTVNKDKEKLYEY